ncbi:MAG: phage protease [Pseudomonadota bacterium]
MTGGSLATALCSAVTIAFDGDAVPEWLHLLPAGEIRTNDGRGPYHVVDATALMAASLPAGEKLVLDECHATDLAAPKGEPAPARGWIVELQARADGIYGRVEWTGQGRAIMADKQYRGLSPAIMHRKDGAVTRILRASLINVPNLVGLASLHSEDHGDTKMNWKLKLIELLGLASDASDEDILAALTKKVGAEGEAAVAAALQSALAPISAIVGLPANADAAAVLAGVQARTGDASGDTLITSLQARLGAAETALETIRGSSASDKAIAFVDAAIGRGAAGLKPMRDEYVAMHMENPARAEKLIGAMPVLHGTRLVGAPPKPGEASLSEADEQAIALMGLDRAAFLTTRAAEAAQQETL